MPNNEKYTTYHLFFYFIILTNIAYASIFSGFINDSSNGEPLAYTNIILLNESGNFSYGTASDLEGYFIMPDVLPGKYNVRIMLIGYDTYDSEIVIDENNIRLNFNLNPEPIKTNEIKVSAERMRFEKRVDISRVNLTNRDIKRAPSFIESDIFRTIQLLPSVSASNDFNSALIVRGGSPDENLILIDGAEIYNPYHIGGVFSTFNSDMISDTEFLAGGFPAQYSSRLSSVLSITSRKGDSKNGKLNDTNPIKPYWDYSKGSGSVSILSSKILVEGPLYNGSWMLSARRTYFDQFLDAYYYATDGNKSPSNYYFWDTQFKATTKITQNNHLTFSQFSGKDDLKINVGGEDFPEIGFNWDWGNSMKSLSWKYIPNMNYFLETNLSNTNYTFNVDFDIEFITDTTETETDTTNIPIDLSVNLYNVVEDITLDQSINYIPSEKLKLKIGWQYKLLKLDYEEYFTGSQTTNIESMPNIFSGYITGTWQLLPSLYINPGLRISKYNRYDEGLIDPRFAIKYNPNSDLALKFSWGKFSQFLYTINKENELLRIVDFWQPIPNKQKPQEVDHFIIGAEYWISEGNTFSIESYYKPYHHVYDLNPKVDNDNIDSTIAVSGTGKAYGIELLYKLNVNKFSGWVSYAYSQINREIDLNSDGILWEEKEIYPAKYNKPHSFNAVLSFQYSPKYNIGLACVFGSGQTYTPIIGRTYQAGVGSYGSIPNPYSNLGNIYGARNSSQYPPYFRLDLSLSRKTNLFGMDGTLKFQFINLTNYYNVLLYNWDHTSSPSRVTAYSMFPIIFTFGWDFKF